ncbi:MAG: hypothetical protein RIQ93_1285 [Verrucomicrobiota bacterium]|jgi:type IV pilus assembly protein PilM
MRSPRVFAVDVGAAHVSWGVFSAGASGRLVLQQFAFERHSSDPARESRWATDIGQALGLILQRQKSTGPVAVSVPGHLVLVKFIKTHSIEPAKRGKIIAFEAAENIPHPLEEVVWDYQVVSDDSFDLEVMIAAAKFEAMQSLCGAADAVGLPIERATPVAVTVRHGFRYNYPRTVESVIVADIGARSTQLLYLEGDRFYVRTLALAGNAVTQAIAEELGTDFASAEALKVQVLSGLSDRPAHSPSRLAVQRAVENFTARLQLEITRSTLNHRRHSGGATPVALYLAGGGSLLPDLATALKDKLQIPVERYDPLNMVDLSGDARAAGADSAGPMLAGLVGLATRLVAKQEAEPSLLPSSVTDALALRKRQPWFLAAAALLMTALLPPVLYFQSLARKNNADVVALEREMAPLRSLQTRNDDNQRHIEEVRKQIDALRVAYETRANWVNFFADIQSRLAKVEDVWLDRLQVIRPPAGSEAATPAATAELPAADPNAPADGRPAVPATPPLRLTLSGRLLDVANPQSRVSEGSLQRVQELLTSFAGSRFIASVENEHFDNSQNGLLRFDFTLVLNPQNPL